MQPGILAAVLCLLAVSAQAGKINLPTRYVHKTFSVHGVSGTKINEKSQDVVVPSPLEITKATVNGKDFLRFRTPRKSPSDTSEESEVQMDYGKKQELLDALSTLPARLRQNDTKPEDAEDELFLVDHIRLSCISVKKPKKLCFELNVAGRVYVINDGTDLRKIVGLLNQL